MTVEKRDFSFYWDLYNKKDPKYTMLKYALFQEIENYFVGSFSIDGDEDFEYIQNKFLKYLFRYGEIFITRYNGKFQLWRVGIKYNKGIYVDTLMTSLIQENIPNNYQSMFVKQKNYVNGIYVKWDNTNMNMYQKYDDYVKTQIDYIKSWHTSVLLDNKKFVFTSQDKDNEIARQEINSMLDPSSAIIYNHIPSSSNAMTMMNMIQELKFGDSKSGLTYQNIQNLRNLYKDIFGMVGNNYFKKANLTENESLIDNYAQENLSLIIKRNLQRFVRDAKKLWNIDLNINKNNELVQKQGAQDDKTKQDNIDTD